MRVIITGATGMVGEGVLLACLAHPDVESVLLVSRKPFGGTPHPKVSECLVPDFLHLEGVTEQLKGYDACFFCAGVSSVGMNESDYTKVTYDLTTHFARTLAQLNPGLVFDYVSGTHTDSSEQGRVMWARVKGRTENALMKSGARKVYNFRPGAMEPMPGQTHLKGIYRAFLWLIPVFRLFMPKQILTLQQVGSAMINSVTKDYPKQILEIADIRALAEA